MSQNPNGSFVSEQGIQECRRKLNSLATEPKSLQRTLKAIGAIGTALSTIGIQAIIVGGQAVEIYTFGNYATMDVDLVLSGRDQADAFLVAVGFEPKSSGQRHWYHAVLDLPIEIPDSVLMGSIDKVFQLQVDDATVNVIGIEDLILDRLRAGVHWKSNSDMEWAKYLIEAYITDIDGAYLESEAKKPDTDVFDAYSMVLAMIQGKHQ